MIRLNGNTDLCYARADQNGASADNGTPSCGAVTTLSAGKGWFTYVPSQVLV